MICSLLPNEVEANGIMKRRRGTRRVVRRTDAQWQELVEHFEQRGRSRKRFCAAHGVALSTFDLWRRKLRGAPAARGTDVPGGALGVDREGGVE